VGDDDHRTTTGGGIQGDVITREEYAMSGGCGQISSGIERGKR
jgi:hypothetical protein